MASKVREPVPKGSLHVFDWEASPLHDRSLPIAPVISKSKFAPVMSSSRVPEPIMVAVWPRVRDAGLKSLTVTCALPLPQSSQEIFTWFAATLVANDAPATTAFIIMATVKFVRAQIVREIALTA